MNNKLIITKLLMQETGTYDTMYRRSFNASLNNIDADTIISRVNQKHQRGSSVSTYDPQLLAGVSGNIIQYSGVDEGPIDIINGWDTKRIRFLLEVEVSYNTGSVEIYYFQGYTDHLGISFSGNLDENMIFQINSFTRLNRQADTYNSNGHRTRDIVTESSQIIIPNFTSHSESDFRHNSLFSMRPCDMFSGIQSHSLVTNDDQDIDGNLLDGRVMFNEPVKSRRQNNIASNYLGKIMTSYSSGQLLSDYGNSDIDILERSISCCREEDFIENPFFRAMSSIKGLAGGTRFTYKDLLLLDPNTVNVSQFISLAPTQKRTQSQPGEMCGWNDATRESVVATMLSNSVSAIMMDLMINNIHFRTTNNDLNAKVTTHIIDSSTMIVGDVRRNFDMFKLRLETEILPDVSFNNEEVFEIEMIADLYGETRLNFSLGNQPIVSYVTPSFCDSLLTPVMTGHKEIFYNNASNMENLLDTITQGDNDYMYHNNL